jgi:hypothetical protein
MKHYFSTLVALALICGIQAQKKLDISGAEELLKILPSRIKGVDIRLEKDKIKPSTGFIGVSVFREYGTPDQNIRIVLINDSPSLPVINDFIEKAASVKSVNNTVVSVDGMPGVLQTLIGEDGKTNYEIVVPLTATLLSIRSKGYDRDDLLEIANNINVSQMAKKLSK